MAGNAMRAFSNHPRKPMLLRHFHLEKGVQVSVPRAFPPRLVTSDNYP
jgi:hypothetical protein